MTLKYYDCAITFSEFPDEVALCLNISSCPGLCKDCSEPWLLEDVGTELTNEEIDILIEKYKDITVFGLMGGDNDHKDCIRIADYIHTNYPNIKVGMYSGRNFINLELANHLDLYKIGSWIMPSKNKDEWTERNWGPLQWPVSNQLYFERIGGILYNATYKFRKNKIGDWSNFVIWPDSESSVEVNKK